MSTYVLGSVEYIWVTVTANVSLGTQPVAVSLNDGATWLPCTWRGTAGTTRKAQTDSPVVFNTALRGSNRVLVRITDTTETPIVSAGNVTVVS